MAGKRTKQHHRLKTLEKLVFPWVRSDWGDFSDLHNFVMEKKNIGLSSRVQYNDRHVMEMQGDIAELQSELDGGEENEISEIKNQLEVIKNDLDAIENLKSAEDVVKSGKLNKLKRLLANFSDKNSNERKVVAGIKNIAVMIGGLLTKYNSLADKIGISKLPF